MGRIWLLALVCAACARSTGGGAAGSFAITYPDAPPTGARVKAGAHFYAKPAS